MANSKNTIQNIPLASELCMNALKTEVKQFQGYNEKNTTLYGGTLSPMWDNKKELPFDKDNSYTFFNSKGQDFTLVKEGNQIHLYKGTEQVSDLVGNVVSYTKKLDVPKNTFAAAKTENYIVYVTNDGKIYKDDELLRETEPDFEYPDTEKERNIVDCQFYYRYLQDMTIIVLTYGARISSENWTKTVNLTNIYFIDSAGSIHRVMTQEQRVEEEASLRAGRDYEKATIKTIVNPREVPFVSFEEVSDQPNYVLLYYSGQKAFYSTNQGIGHDYITPYVINTSDNLLEDGTSFSDGAIVENLGKAGTARFRYDRDRTPQLTYLELERFAGRALSPNHGYCYDYSEAEVFVVRGYVPLPEGGKRFSCPLGANDTLTPELSFDRDWCTSVYYKDGNLISIGCFGQPIAPVLSFTSNIITPYTFYPGNYFRVSYKSGTDWYCYTASTTSWKWQPWEDTLKSLVLDNRYVFMKFYDIIGPQENFLTIYDIESESVLSEKHLDWILADPILSNYTAPSTKGVVYGAGINAGYTINNAELVGYLPNPYIGEVYWESRQHFVPSWTAPDAQYYFTVGDTTQSAKYQGTDPEYDGTTYPIDPNGNVVLPISMNAQIIKGYSNNDMVKEGNTVYPLMYWNNNQKVYAYYLLAGIENITNVFSLQGQQYAVDDENIYAVAFNGGVVSQVQSVSYKKNLTFLGTLPTQAVFWSDFNKTFYAFTGDRVLSKMFEASDIHKILYVGQNPSSLSLWVCTDTGIYVLSDTDQFRLEYISKMVGFQPKTTMLLTEGEENNEIHAVSLYLDEGEEGEMVPVKLKTSYYGLGNEMKAVMDCWYLRLFDENNTKGYVKAKVHTITDITRHTEEKTFEVNPSDYDENHIVYLRFQPKYQECVSMQLELETNLGIYQISLGVNTTDSTAQVSKFNF